MSSQREVVRQLSGMPVVALLLLLGSPWPVRAHGDRPQLALWGGFPPDAVRCQRVISRAAAQCVAAVSGARQACWGMQLAGEACDTHALDDRVAAIRQHAAALVAAFCNDPQVQNLYYTDLADALDDVGAVCRQLDAETVSAVYGPAIIGGSVGSVSDLERTCLRAAAGGAAKLMRFAVRARQRVLDGIVSRSLELRQKQALIDRSTQRIARARADIARQIGASCSDDAFRSVYGRTMSTFLDSIGGRADCFSESVYRQDAVSCPAPVCGNGIQEGNEECDDGNDFEGDGCLDDCQKSGCDVFPSAYDLIQRAVFENRACTNDACHGDAGLGGLDLRAGFSYENLVDVPSTLNPNLKRVEPGEPNRSLLWLKLAAKTLPDQYPANELGIGSPMPAAGTALTENELEALRLWILAAASRTGSVAGVGNLLNACLPKPKPIEIKPLEPPPPGEGLQLRMPPWIVDAHSEREVCFASYYDFTEQVPASLRGPGDTFCYKSTQLRQDPLSHHLIVNRYYGQYAANDPSFGTYTCSGGHRAGETCDPLDPTTCGVEGICATMPVTGVACIGYGPPDSGPATIPFSGAQQANAAAAFPEGAYRCIPLRGVVLWNSHAFNLTDQPGTLEAWVNFNFAKPEERRHFAQGIFNTSQIFKMVVPACQQQEVCNIHELPEGAQLFELTSHMHQRGKRFRTFRGAFTCADEVDRNGNPIPCDPLDPSQCTAGACTDPTGRNPNQSLLYTSFIYNDPVQLPFNPPLGFSGSSASRSLTYCALYDNGASDPSTVKRKSTSPPTPFGTSTCPVATHCVSGKVCQPCSGSTQAERDASCDSMPDAGDGFCDACTLRGGVTTEDEMFILIGSYFE